MRQDFEEIADQRHVGDFDQRGFRIGVDGDDLLGALNAGEMLQRPGNADGNIEIGGNDLAGLADLPVIGSITSVDGGAGGADSRTERLTKGFD